MLRVSWRHVQKSRASMRHASTLQVCDSIESYRKVRGSIAPGATVGFGLHAGHLSLIQEARKRCDVVVASVFVNPAQFGPNEDFEKYPRTLGADLALLRQENVDIVFTPARDSMYSSSFRTYVDPEGFNDVPEGQCRPGFFRGVATIVAKLFNIVAPTHAFFGQKDAVQCVVIKRVIADLNFPIELHASAVIFAGLKQAADVFAAATAATVPASVLRATIEKVYKSEPRLQSIQYISIASKETMDELDDVSKYQGAIISVAVKVGQCRLIDNIVV
ncbi:hypothetical protein DYB28_008390 [Aphanomyces astaci]|uniref:Pantoate--beta-alanine ligase n=1 Tax=Aphanomyces astaci TaxID=112090 RepID=A0A9X8E4Z5_APHAT|nr:hypothetical protein DYB28_008390 [Aphanomyces astaci]